MKQNIALIFAGGVGSRMNSSAKPKQFLELYGKPVIIYTLEHFEKHAQIDKIVIVCKEDWIEYLKGLLKRFQITKVDLVVPGGATGQESIFNGLEIIEEHYSEESIVLIHDGVRPLINEEIISNNIYSVENFGNGITSCPPQETFVLIDNANSVANVHDRGLSRLAKAPQSFILKDILKVHRQAKKDEYFHAIDSCSLMHRYGYDVKLVEGVTENLKITTPIDFFIFKAIVDTREGMTIYGGM